MKSQLTDFKYKKFNITLMLGHVAQDELLWFILINNIGSSKKYVYYDEWYDNMYCTFRVCAVVCQIFPSLYNKIILIRDLARELVQFCYTKEYLLGGRLI